MARPSLPWVNGENERFRLRWLVVLLAGALSAAALVVVPTPASAAGGPRLVVGDGRLVESDSGYAYLTFPVRLLGATGRPVRVQYETRDGTATAPSDYGPAKGEVSYRGTTVQRKVFVPVFGDTVAEPDETFKLVLSGASGARVRDGVGAGTVVNDDETLTVSRTGSGDVSGSGISCGADCTETYARGTEVTLTASPATGWTFTGWGGACAGTGSCTVTMTQALAVTATFSLQQHTLFVTRTGNGQGTVTALGINCGLDCSEAYTFGTMVTLTATTQPGSSFTGWSGACTGTDSCTVTMTQSRSVTATFSVP